MRKIELEVLEAIRNKTNFSGGNTEVVVSDAGNIQVLLHGSPIVRIENNEKDIFISMAMWNTATTRGRINVALGKYGISRMYNRDGVPFISDRAIPLEGWIRVTREGREIPAETEQGFSLG